MTEIRVTIDDAEVRQALNDAIAAGRDLSPAMRGVAEALRGGVQQAFIDQQAPDGAAWAGLSEVTQEARRKRRTWPGDILRVTGRLSDSVTVDSGPDFAAAGTNLVYAGTHQFGAAKGQFGATARGVPIPWGDIPARPFLGVSADTEVEIADVLRAHLIDATGGAAR